MIKVVLSIILSCEVGTYPLVTGEGPRRCSNQHTAFGAVLDDAYADLFGAAPHIDNETSTHSLLAKRSRIMLKPLKPIPNC